MTQGAPKRKPDWQQSLEEGAGLVKKLADKIGWPWTIGIGVVLLLGIIGAFAGSGTQTSGGDAAPAAKPTAEPAKPSTFRERVSEEAGVKPAGEWSCSSKTKLGCEVAIDYTTSGIGDDFNRTIDATKPLFPVLFRERPRADYVSIGVVGDTVTVGGKEGRGELLRVTCTKQANRDIAWDRITTDGVKTLCSVLKKVKFDD